MSNQEPRLEPQAAALTPLPRVEDLPPVKGGYEADAVREAFDAFRRHTLQLQAQLRVLQAAGKNADMGPTGHAVRMDALHLIRAAAEFADTLERDAQTASAAQLARIEEEVRRRQRELQRRAADIEAFRNESERERSEILNAANAEARKLVATADRDARAELNAADARGARLLEQARHQATELTNAARAEIEQTLEWSRTQAGAIISRAQDGAEQLLTAAGLGPEALAEVSAAILDAARASTEASRGRLAPAPKQIDRPPVTAVPPPEPDEPDEPAAGAPYVAPTVPSEPARRRPRTGPSRG